MTPSRANGRRRFVTAALAAIAVSASLAACGATPTFPFIPNHYTFSKGDVQRAVARKFPTSAPSRRCSTWRSRTRR